MIQNLYESSMKGLLPERQVQRMIQQYDEEQILLERRIGELQEQMKQEEVKKVETERFIALVKKYRDCGEVTDTMLYAFVDRIEVHEATGGRTIYRQQNIDIHFNFIGNYYPPVETISEEERTAAIEAEQLRKKKEKEKRSAERRKQKLEELRNAAEAGDEEAIARYTELLEKQKERGRRYRQKLRKPEKPTRSISGRWKKKNAGSRKNAGSGTKACGACQQEEKADEGRIKRKGRNRPSRR